MTQLCHFVRVKKILKRKEEARVNIRLSKPQKFYTSLLFRNIRLYAVAVLLPRLPIWNAHEVFHKYGEYDFARYPNL